MRQDEIALKLGDPVGWDTGLCQLSEARRDAVCDALFRDDPVDKRGGGFDLAAPVTGKRKRGHPLRDPPQIVEQGLAWNDRHLVHGTVLTRSASEGRAPSRGRT